MNTITELLVKLERELPTNKEKWTLFHYKHARFVDELRAAIDANTSTTSAEQIVRKLAVVKRGSEQAHDLAGEAVMWVAANGDTL